MDMKTLMLALLMLTQTVVSAETTQEPTKPSVLKLSTSNQSESTKSETTHNHQDGTKQTSIQRASTIISENTLDILGGQTSAPDTISTTKYKSSAKSSSTNVQGPNPSTSTSYKITFSPSDVHTSSTTNLSVTTEFETTSNILGESIPTSNPSETSREHSHESTLTSPNTSTVTEYETTSNFQGGQSPAPDSISTTLIENKSFTSSAKVPNPNLNFTTVSKAMLNPSDGQASTTYPSVTTEFETSSSPSGEISHTSNPSETTQKHSGETILNTLFPSIAAEYQTTSEIARQQTSISDPTATTEIENTSNPPGASLQNSEIYGITVSIKSELATTEETFQTSNSGEATRKYTDGSMSTNTNSITVTNYEMNSIISGEQTTPVPKHNSASTTRSAHLTSTPTRRSIFTKKPENLELQLSFTVKIKEKFIKELNDTTSKPYKKLATDFKAALEISFRISPGFSHVVIKGFRNGSVICDYFAVYKDVKNISTLKTEITTVITKIEQQKIGNAAMAPVHMAEDFTKATGHLCEAFKEPCGKGYTCKSSDAGVITCTSFCAKKENKCQNRGKCFYDVVSSQTDCRCVHDEDYVYSGRYCENKHEKLAMSSTYIIIISSCAGGSVILILIIVIIVMAVKRKGRGVNKNQYLDDEDDKHRSVGMDEMYPNRFSNPYTSKSRGNTLQNEYQSGLPDTRYVGGRQHRVLTDDTGSETYLYQPFKQPLQGRPASATSSEPEARPERAGSVYDYIDTDATYQIKRPTFKMGYFNKV